MKAVQPFSMPLPKEMHPFCATLGRWNIKPFDLQSTLCRQSIPITITHIKLHSPCLCSCSPLHKKHKLKSCFPPVARVRITKQTFFFRGIFRCFSFAVGHSQCLRTDIFDVFLFQVQFYDMGITADHAHRVCVWPPMLTFSWEGPGGGEGHHVLWAKGEAGDSDYQLDGTLCFKTCARHVPKQIKNTM